MNIKAILKYPAITAEVIIALTISVIMAGSLMMITVNIINGIFPRPQVQTVEKPSLYTNQRLLRINDSEKEFLPDGTIHLIHHPRSENMPGYGNSKTPEIAEIYDTADNLLWQGESRNIPYTYLTNRFERSGNIYPRSMQRRGPEPDFSRTLSVPVVTNGREIVQRWRYVPRHGYFIGTDNRGKIIGYAGANGIKETPKQIEPLELPDIINAWCPAGSHSPVLLWTAGSKVYQISFSTNSFQLLINAPGHKFERVRLNNWKNFDLLNKPVTDGRSVRTETRLEGKTREELEITARTRPAIHLKTESDQHFLVFRDPLRQVKVNLPEDHVPNHNSPSFFAFNDKVFMSRSGPKVSLNTPSLCLICGESEHKLNPNHRFTELYQVMENGDIAMINSFQWQKYPPYFERNWWGPESYIDQIYYGMEDYATATLPILTNILWHSYYNKILTQGYRERSSFDSFTYEMLSVVHPTNISYNIILSAIMLCLALAHAWPRRTSWAKLIFWTVLVTLFNIGGIITYLSLNHTAIIKCPVCGKKRGLQRPDCIACGTNLPEPEQKQTDLVMN